MAQAKLHGWGNEWGNRCIKGVALVVHFSQGKTQTTQGMLAPTSFFLQQKRCSQLLPSPDARLRWTLHCALHKSCHSGQQSCFHQGLQPTLQWHCAPMAAYPAAFCNVITTKSHPTMYPAAVIAQTQDFASWTPLVTRRVSPVKIPWHLFYCSPA